MKKTYSKDLLLFIAELKALVPKSYLDYRIKGSLDRWIQFVVSSPETRNFSQYFHLYNPLRMIYRIPIRGWNGKWTQYYWYEGIDLDLIQKAIMTYNYGRVIFSLLRSTTPKGVKWGKDANLLKVEHPFRRK